MQDKLTPREILQGLALTEQKTNRPQSQPASGSRKPIKICTPIILQKAGAVKMFDLKYVTRQRFAFGVMDNQFVILTGYRCDRKTGGFVSTSRIPLNASQAAGIESCPPPMRAKVIAGFVTMFGKIASGEWDQPVFASELSADDYCPRCGEAPRAEGDIVCADCRAELISTQPAPRSVPAPPTYQRPEVLICPICGNKVVDECSCKKHGAVICRKHCYQGDRCKHLDSRISIERCRYPRYIEDGILKTGKEVPA